jgi:pSer/pThr/pTyr-binding forkhead associated (FHA) protein
VVWARLVGEGRSHEIGRNRALVGRSESADVTIAHDDVSRRHALIWREGGRVFLRDLASANGTLVDGVPLADDPAELSMGSMVTLASHRYRLAGV